MRIPPFTIRHGIGEALVRRFQAETGTFHLSYGKYAVLPLDWIAILGIRFNGHQILTKEISFYMACDLLGIPFLLTAEIRGYFEPTASPQIRTKWLQHSIPWGEAPIDAYLRQCFLWFLDSCFLGNNRSVLTC